MAMVRELTVNLIPGGFVPVIHVNQYDAGLITYKVTVLEGDSAASFPVGTTVKAQGRKPSGLGFSESETLSGNVVTWDIIATMTEEGGNIPCELVFFNGDDRISTINILMMVEFSPHPAGITDGDTETARTLLEQMQQALSDAQTAAATVNPQEVTSAETAPTLSADAQKIYLYSNPLTALDLTPAADGITEIFFTADAGGCTLTLPLAVNVPPGLTVTAGATTQDITIPGSFKYELNIFENYMLLEAWE